MNGLRILLIGLLLAVTPSAASAAEVRTAALGDSFTAGTHTGCATIKLCYSNSWATGTLPTVVSFAGRSGGRSANFALPGRQVKALSLQAEQAVAVRPAQVVIMIGLNDLCTRSPAGATTSLASFRASFQAAMNRLRAGLPTARVLVASIPDPYLLWQRWRTDPAARGKWARLRICESMLTDPLGTSPATVARRNRVRAAGRDFNAAMAAVCAGWKNCRTDRGAVNTRFAWGVTVQDYFHPSLKGQGELAALVWGAS